jgi:CRP-like cAMP-binding protein
VIAPEARAAFLRRMHLFHDLKDEELAAIASALEEETCNQGDEIYVQGDYPERCFIIYRGGVRLSELKRGQEQTVAALADGDYFGDEELLTRRKRVAGAVAAESTTLFSLSASDFTALVKKYPKLKLALGVSAGSRQLARHLHFSWLGPAEVIHFLARKHEVVLAQSLSLPIIALAIPIFLLVQFFLTRAFFTIFGAGILFLLIVLWMVWNWIDWGNDYYIVTNQRVVWLEKVVGLYDSRQEAPLSTLLSVGVETDMSGRLLDYGDLIVRTFVGKIVFHHVAHPFEAEHVVQELWTRSRRVASKTEREAMRNVLRSKMGLPVQITLDETAAEGEPEKMVTPSLYRRSILRVLESNWFKLRIEDSGTITYRKHWFVMLRQVAQPTVLLLLMGFGMIARLVTLAGRPELKLFDFSKTPPVDTMMLTIPILMIPVVLWWIYQYLDWRNDIYQVTPDEILDIDKKPFGSETRRSAPLENILSTESERVGLTGYLLNYGTVYITVGGANLDFEDVLDPPTVQADIDRRREARVALKKEVEAASERERMSEWLVAYHENEAEWRKAQGAAESGPKSK